MRIETLGGKATFCSNTIVALIRKPIALLRQSLFHPSILLRTSITKHQACVPFFPLLSAGRTNHGP